MNPGTSIFVIALSLLSATGQAATVDEIIDKIDYNQSLGIAYMLTVEEIEQLEQSSDPAAHYYLGLVYAEGDTPNTARDQCKATELMLEAAADDNPYAYIYLVFAGRWGVGAHMNVVTAKSFLAKSQQLLSESKKLPTITNSVPYNFRKETDVAGRVRACQKYFDDVYPDILPSLETSKVEVARPCIRENTPGSSFDRSILNLLDAGDAELSYWREKATYHYCIPPNLYPLTYGYN